MLDNYDTNLHLKHTEHLAGWCTMAMITGGKRNQAQTTRDCRGRVDGHRKVTRVSISAHVGEYSCLQHARMLESDFDLNF